MSRLSESHLCPAAVLCCVDFRFWGAIARFVREELGIVEFDLLTDPGGIKYIAEENKKMLDAVRAQLNVAYELHHARTLLLFNHQDCGGYGGSGSFAGPEDERARHEAHLLAAMEELRLEYPRAGIRAFYAHFAGEGVAFAEVR